jgi:ADP-heptose:LPS heptosyltransferase
MNPTRSSELQRALDRHIGAPLVRIVGAFRNRRSVPVSVRHIGLIQPIAIGDLILLGPLLQHVGRCYPDATLHVFHGPTNAEAVPLLPVEVAAHRCDFRNLKSSVDALRRVDLDILIDGTGWPHMTALISALSGARFTVGYRLARAQSHQAFDVSVPYRSDRHETENHRSIAEIFGPVNGSYLPAMRRGGGGVDVGAPLDRLLVMHMFPGGSRAREKSWPVDYWRALVTQLASEGWHIGFTGSQRDRQAAQDVVTAMALPEGRCVVLAGRLTLAETAWLLERARLVVTVDTSVAHLASALDVPCVGLYGPTKSARWGPINKRSIALDAPHPDGGYIHIGNERHPRGGEIMATLSVESVRGAIDKMLQDPF